MNIDPNDPLDQLLTRRLSDQLGSQVGRAARAFDELVSREAPAPARKVSSGRGVFVIGPLLGLAAAVAVVVTVAGVLLTDRNTNRPPVARSGAVPVKTVAAKADDVAQVRRDVTWKTEDAGIVFLSAGKPMQAIRQQRVERASWYDPEAGATIQLTVPREEVTLIGLSKQ